MAVPPDPQRRSLPTGSSARSGGTRQGEAAPECCTVLDCADAVALSLQVQFGDRLPRGCIAAVVAAARRDLEGQVPPAALGEMLHRLAAYRLETLDAALPVT
jgi:hypothetical protein